MTEETNRKLASIQRITKIEDVPNSDNLQKVSILGWEIIVNKKENFQVNQLVCYIEIDSLLPEKPEFEFMRARKFRVRTIRLRGSYSQGIVFPLSILPEVRSPYKEGEDVSTIIGVRKYNPEVEPIVEQKVPKNKLVKFLCRYKVFRNIFLEPKEKGGFPTHIIRKTDEERINSLSNLFEESFKGTTGWWCTEKAEGTSFSAFLTTKTNKIFKVFSRSKKVFGICSRNMYLKTPYKCHYWDVANQYSIKEKLSKVPYDVAIQGEIIGTGIQKNYYGISGYELYLFTVKNLSENRYFSNEEVLKFCEEYGFKMVPTVDSNYTIPETIQELVEFSKGKSKINPKLLREGIVLRKDSHSFKVINPEYLLKSDL